MAVAAHAVYQALTAAQEAQLRDLDEQVWQSEVEITEIVPELEMVVARSVRDNLDDIGVKVAPAVRTDLELRLWDGIPGVHWRELRAQQHLRLKVRGFLAPRVLSAEVA
jgi:hypothetical protein